MTFKPYFKSLLRRAGFLSLAERWRFTLEKIKYRSINRQFMNEHPEFAFPPAFFIYETYRLRYDQYYRDGLETSKEILDLIEKANGTLKGEIKLLDWGCGPGRITRHLPALLPEGSSVYGADYNEDYINWCKRNLIAIHFSIASIHPPIGFAGDFFDIILGLSVFTHLSRSNHDEWIHELSRMLKPGGLLYITTQGNSFRIKLTKAEKQQFDAGQIVVRENRLEGNRLYSAFEPASFMKMILEPKFEIIEFLPGVMDKEPVQDCWLLKKKFS